MSDHSTNWSKEEFHCYLLVFLSHADLNVDKKEVAYIKSRFPGGMYERMEEEFEEDNDYQSIQKIQSTFKRHGYDNSEIKVIHEELMGLFQADGKVDIMEKSLMSTLERILA